MRPPIKKSKTQNLILSLSNQILYRVCSYKCLGFTLDEHLNFNKHISDMNQLISHKLYLLSQIRKCITIEASINIFRTMILSLIEYGDIIYNGTSQANLDKIDKSFYRGLRICINANNHIINPELCIASKISTLQNRYSCHLLLFMHEQSSNHIFLEHRTRNMRMHDAPVFNMYKPKNERVKPIFRCDAKLLGRAILRYLAKLPPTHESKASFGPQRVIESSVI